MSEPVLEAPIPNPVSAGWQIAGGSVLGRDHRLVGKNCHDAFGARITDDHIYGVVCDGCGSGKHSEVGAKLGTRFLLEALGSEIQGFISMGGFTDGFEPAWLLENVRQMVLEKIRVNATDMGRSFSATINDYFLFTTVGFFLTGDEAVFFSLGDGFVIINGDILELGPFPDNAPPYLAYGLVQTAMREKNPELLEFQILRRVPLYALHSFLLGTDGVGDIRAALGKTLPGKTEPVPPLHHFWETSKYFENPELINRRLALMAQDVAKPNWDERRMILHPGLLPDDTTFIVGRRKPTEQ